jgi:O-antigen/teichoic acid export membrane protein
MTLTPRKIAQDQTAATEADKLAKNPSEGFTRDVSVSVIGYFFPPAMAVLSGPLLAHGLGVNGRGASAAATAPLLLITVGATFGIPETITHFVARDRRVLWGSVTRGLCLTLLLGVGMTFLVIACATRLSGGNTTIRREMFLASFFITPTLVLGVIRGAAGGMRLWRRVALDRSIGAVARVVMLFALVGAGRLTVTSATVTVAGSPLVGFLAYLRLGRQIPSRLERPEERLGLEPARYAVRLWVGSVSGVLLSRLDQTLMTPLASAHQLGLYAVAASLSELCLVVNSATRDVVFAADSSDRNESRLTQSARISTAAALAAAVAIALLTQFTIGFIFGPAFRSALPALMILLIALVAGNPGSMAGAGLSARGNPGLRSLALTIACIVNCGLLFLLVPRYGATGAAEATLVGYLISSILVLIFLRKVHGVPMRGFYGLRKEDILLAQYRLQAVRESLFALRKRESEKS